MREAGGGGRVPAGAEHDPDVRAFRAVSVVEGAAVQGDAVGRGGGHGHAAAGLGPPARNGRKATLRIVGEPVGRGQRERSVGGGHGVHPLFVPVLPGGVRVAAVDVVDHAGHISTPAGTGIPEYAVRARARSRTAADRASGAPGHRLGVSFGAACRPAPCRGSRTTRTSTAARATRPELSSCSRSSTRRSSSRRSCSCSRRIRRTTRRASCATTGPRGPCSTAGTCRTARPRPRSLPAVRAAASAAAASPAAGRSPAPKRPSDPPGPRPVGPRGGRVGAPGRAEGAVHRGAQFVDEQPVGQSRVRELGVLEGEPDAVQGVVAQPPGLGERGAGGGEGVPGAARASASRSSTASRRWASRPKSRPASASAAALPGLPASCAVCAKAAAVAVSVGSVTASTGVPIPASTSMPACRSTASTRTAVSKPREAPVRAPARSQERATRRAATARGRAPTARPGRRRGPVPSPRPAPGRRRPRAGRPRRGRPGRCACRAAGRVRRCAGSAGPDRPEPPSGRIPAARRSW